MIKTLLIANRGEIALRVIRTARDLGIHTVAIHTDIDASAPHAREADAAVRVTSYLDIDAVVAAARDCRCRRGAPRLRLPLRALRLRPRRSRTPASRWSARPPT